MGTDMKLCSQCKKVQYCGPKCQTADWSYHKPKCLLGLEEGTVLACAQCGKADNVKDRCSACLKVFYCSVDCQKLHWKAVRKTKKNCEEMSGSQKSLYSQHKSECKKQ